MFNINFANDWIRTAYLWYWKRPLYQLSHNHFQKLLLQEAKRNEIETEDEQYLGEYWGEFWQNI